MSYTNTATKHRYYTGIVQQRFVNEPIFPQAGVDFLRLGSKHAVHPSLHQFLPSYTMCTSVSELEALYNSKSVVATTCLGVNHAVFSRRTFDYCIVDEASQLTLPVSLGPLRCAAVFVLVGDHYQLPPLVRDSEARERGLGVSLFRLLSEHHPNSMVMLDEQYRMNSDIMLLSNTLFYNHQLKCGSVGVASGRLALPLPQCLSRDCPRWLRRSLSPDTPVIFLNTDKLEDGSESSGCGEKIWNKQALITYRVEYICHFNCFCVKCGVTGDQVGVVTPYRHQQTKIKEALINLPLTQC
ncbi:DNA replication ATP-dependent helicase/nuclease DNA2 [Geodia barretti]|uniref:DNA replication ATP-dependent helicase/nuclease n=1 Tax=Geodia barretti TaxID=519541 RepID=A0AA35WM71_GEOBA|nr:DNA replication ATP-dependent helicase/nuclease DNA2 [Geodia barretti]